MAYHASSAVCFFLEIKDLVSARGLGDTKELFVSSLRSSSSDEQQAILVASVDLCTFIAPWACEHFREIADNEFLAVRSIE